MDQFAAQKMICIKKVNSKRENDDKKMDEQKQQKKMLQQLMNPQMNQKRRLKMQTKNDELNEPGVEGDELTEENEIRLLSLLVIWCLKILPVTLG